MSEQPLVQIGAKKAAEDSGISRRKFLKILGSSSVAGAVGCSDDTSHKALPHVVGQDNAVPGVAAWFRSTCQECSAGCGIQVRTREGRAVKVEGNPDHPVNRGGLCALGQASVQGLYDPDRVRQPLKRDSGSGSTPTFSPISWEEAYKQVAEAIILQKGKIGVLTHEVNGSLKSLIDQFLEGAGGGEHLTFDPLQPASVAEASELVYGKAGVPEYRFDKADVVLNFGADFLETWVSPCGYARDWASTRTGKHPAKVIHIEPRLSLTGANADLWLQSKAGSEPFIALFLLGALLRNGKGKNLAPDLQEKLRALSEGVSVQQASERSGVSEQQLLLIAERLTGAKAALIVSGGAAASTPEGQKLALLSALLNLVTGSVGKTVDLSSMRPVSTSLGGLVSFLGALESGEQGLLLVKDSNPAYQLPSAYGFEYSIRKARLKQLELGNTGVPVLISFSSVLDETAMLADLILPSHHFLEDWGDAVPKPGVYSVTQPSMTPVFDTRSFGDSLLSLAKDSGVGDLAPDFHTFVQKEWEKIHEREGVTEPFQRWWADCVELGGYFPKRSEERSRVSVSDGVFEVDFKEPTALSGGKDGELLVYPFPSVKSFDGRSANRPWLQELPDPITQVVWDAWGEIHPDTAAVMEVKQGDLLLVRNGNGELKLPAYVTEHVHPGIVAVPLGQGHKAVGRYAKAVSERGNPFSLLPPSDAPERSLPLLSAFASVTRGRGEPGLVITQGSDSQHGRKLARTKVEKVKGGAAGDDHGGDDHGGHGGGDYGHGGGHHGHHEVKQMYKQRKHPMYDWVLTVDLASCTGCSACVTACYAENNIPVVGKEICAQGREMSWIRIERYYDKGPSEELQVSFLPAMCQHCNNAPCEPVCPVYATYHNPEGLNVMVYNRCVGTRYCSNNCSYKQRRFNWYEYEFPEPLNLQLNPDVTKRSAGVMEKCTFCVQRIAEAKDNAKDLGRPVQDGEVQPACVQSCPTKALSFGNINDKESDVYRLSHDERAYKVLDHHLNTQPSVSYLENVKYKV